MKKPDWSLTSALSLGIWLLGTPSGHCFFNCKYNIDEATVVAGTKAPSHRACDSPVVGTRCTSAATGPNAARLTTKCLTDQRDRVYYGYRYYNASTGRWLSRDPLLEESHLLSERSRKEPHPEDRAVTVAQESFKPFRGGRGRFYFGNESAQALFKVPTNLNIDFLEYQFCRNDSLSRFDLDGRGDAPGCGYWITQGTIGLAVAAADWIIKQKKCLELAEHPDEEMFGPSPGAAVLTIANMAAIIVHCPSGGKVYMHVWFDGKCNCKSDYVVICNNCSGGT